MVVIGSLLYSIVVKFMTNNYASPNRCAESTFLWFFIRLTRGSHSSSDDNRGMTRVVASHWLKQTIESLLLSTSATTQ